MVSGNLSGLNLSATGLLLSGGVLVLIYEPLVWTHWWDIFTPLLLHRLGEHRGRGITSCFYCSQPLLCPVTKKPGVGTEVSLCVSGWWATKHESEGEGRVHVRSLVCPRILWSGRCHPAFYEVRVQPYEWYTIGRAEKVQLLENQTSAPTFRPPLLSVANSPAEARLLSDLVFFTLALNFFVLPLLWKKNLHRPELIWFQTFQKFVFPCANLFG